MLYIAEKPELARAIVEGLGGGVKRGGLAAASNAAGITNAATTA